MFKRIFLSVLIGMIGLAILAGLLLATLPARMMVSVVDPADDMGLRQVQGTLWWGEGRLQRPGREALQANWRWSPPLAWQWELEGEDVDLRGSAFPAFDRSLEMREVTGTIDARRLDIDAWLPNVVPAGDFVLDISHIRYEKGRVTGLEGQVTWYNGYLHGAIEESLGTIEILFEPGEAGFEAGIRSVDLAPITVRGRLVLEGGNYEADLWLRAEAGRPELARQLARIGERQPDGQVRLRQSGRLF